jgi:hypothetical protein
MLLLGGAQQAIAYEGYGAKTFPASVYGNYPLQGDAANSPAVESLAAAYNSSLGALTIHVRFYGPVASFQSLLTIGFGEWITTATIGPPSQCAYSDEYQLMYPWGGGTTATLTGPGPGEAGSSIDPTQTVDGDGLGITWTISQGPAWLQHQTLTCANIDLGYTSVTDPFGGYVPFVIPLSDSDARSAFLHILAKGGLHGRGARSIAGSTRCRALSSEAVTCAATNHDAGQFARINGTLTHKLGDTTIFGSITVKLTQPCGRRRCTRTAHVSGSVSGIGV